ncbi:MAG: iron ABC transporter permease [Oscillospiraceae bacterium]|nr:iron ABC transporter permease [Oscillospiraceae bacterium]
MTEKRNFRARLVILAALALLIAAAALLLGRYDLSAGDSVRAAIVMVRIRLPRILASSLVGAALSAAGATYQGVFRNPMVSPDLLGASSGAGFGAALALLLSLNYTAVTLSAFIFGLGAVALAMVIGRAAKSDATLSLVLAGIVVSSLFNGGTSFLKLSADTDEALPAITYWLMGNLSGVKLTDIAFAAPPILVGLVILFLIRWQLNLLTMGEEEARSMGVNTRKIRRAAIFAATLMTAAAVSISGMIGWVGLVIPHFVRILFGYDYRRVIPASIFMGAAFLTAVDTVARVATTAELPIGILTSFIGAPIFVILLVKGGAKRGA